jgi:hypothetical protein
VLRAIVFLVIGALLLLIEIVGYWLLDVSERLGPRSPAGALILASAGVAFVVGLSFLAAGR